MIIQIWHFIHSVTEEGEQDILYKFTKINTRQLKFKLKVDKNNKIKNNDKTKKIQKKSSNRRITQKNKKFMMGKFKELILSIASHPMAEQRKLIEQTLDSWKGKIKQVDDMCIIGVRV